MMKTLNTQGLGLQELDQNQLQQISGGSEFSRSVGEFCGWVVGCATNAAEKLTTIITDWYIGEKLGKAIK